MLIFLAVLGTARSQNAGTATFAGDWCNQNFDTNLNTRVRIGFVGNKYSVHMWGRCVPAECDWGVQTATLDPSDNSLHLAWNQAAAVVAQRIVLLDDGSLEVDSHTHFKSKGGVADFDSQETFAKGLRHDWGSAPAPQPPPRFPPPSQPHLPPPLPPPPAPYPKTSTPVAVPLPIEEITDVLADGRRPGLVTFTFKTHSKTIAKVEISRKPLVDHKLQSVLTGGADAAPTTTHRISLSGLGTKTSDKYYYVVTAAADRASGFFYSSTP